MVTQGDCGDLRSSVVHSINNRHRSFGLWGLRGDYMCVYVCVGGRGGGTVAGGEELKDFFVQFVALLHSSMVLCFGLFAALWVFCTFGSCLCDSDWCDVLPIQSYISTGYIYSALFISTKGVSTFFTSVWFVLKDFAWWVECLESSKDQGIIPVAPPTTHTHRHKHSSYTSCLMIRTYRSSM